MNRFRALERPSLLNRGRSESASMSVCLCVWLPVYEAVRFAKCTGHAAFISPYWCMKLCNVERYTGVSEAGRASEDRVAPTISTCAQTGWVASLQGLCWFCVVAFPGSRGLSLPYSLSFITEQCVLLCVLTCDVFVHLPRLTPNNKDF